LSLVQLEPTRPVSLMDPVGSADPSGTALSWLGFGVTPVVAAFVLVELVAVAVPAWRWRRVSGAVARRPLVFASWGLGLGFTALQAGALARASDDLALGGKAMVGTLVSWGLVLAVSRFGLMNGFAAALLASLVGLEEVQRLRGLLVLGELPPGLVLLLVAGVAGAVRTMVFMARRSGPPADVPVRAAPPISGLHLADVASALMTLPMTLASVVPGIVGRTHQLFSSRLLFTVLWALLASLLTVGLSLAYFRPRSVGAMWKRWNPSIDEVSAVLAARAALPPAIRDALVLNMAFAVALSVTVQVGASLVGAALLATVIVLDAVDEWRFRLAHGPLVVLLELHRVPEVDAVMHRLTTQQVPALARARHYRASQQFFGPNVPIEVMVPATRVDEAKALLGS
jgi:hypothetical protein